MDTITEQKNIINIIQMKKKKEALRYHNEGIGFRKIGRLLGMDPKSVINWIKEAAKQIQNKKQEFIREGLRLNGICPKVFIDKKTGKIIAWGNTLSTHALNRGFLAKLGI